METSSKKEARIALGRARSTVTKLCVKRTSPNLNQSNRLKRRPMWKLSWPQAKRAARGKVRHRESPWRVTTQLPQTSLLTQWNIRSWRKIGPVILSRSYLSPLIVCTRQRLPSDNFVCKRRTELKIDKRKKVPRLGDNYLCA